MRPTSTPCPIRFPCQPSEQPSPPKKSSCGPSAVFNLKNAVGLAISRFLGDNPTFHRQFISPKWCRKNRRCGPAARRMMRWNGSAISSVMQRRRWAATAVFGIMGCLCSSGSHLHGAQRSSAARIQMGASKAFRSSADKLPRLWPLSSYRASARACLRAWRAMTFSSMVPAATSR